MNTPDSLLQYDSYTRGYADSLFHAVKVVGDNTDSFGGISGWITWMSFAASMVTIFGLLMSALKFILGGPTFAVRKRLFWP